MSLLYSVLTMWQDQKLMDKLAGLYAAKTLPDEWVVFDMAAYGAMKAAEGTEKAQISDSAKQNYINLAIDELNQSYTLPTDRAKAEIIMGAIGIDTTKLYPGQCQRAYQQRGTFKKRKLWNRLYHGSVGIVGRYAGQRSI